MASNTDEINILSDSEQSKSSERAMKKSWKWDNFEKVQNNKIILSVF